LDKTEDVERKRSDSDHDAGDSSGNTTTKQKR
jgi:hypothetical protein